MDPKLELFDLVWFGINFPNPNPRPDPTNLFLIKRSVSGLGYKAGSEMGLKVGSGSPINHSESTTLVKVQLGAKPGSGSILT